MGYEDAAALHQPRTASCRAPAAPLRSCRPPSRRAGAGRGPSADDRGLSARRLRRRDHLGRNRPRAGTDELNARRGSAGRSRHLARIVFVMPRLALLASLLLVASTLRADCIANGHYTIVGNASPQIGTRFPYTEDLVHHLDDRPVGARTLVTYSSDLHWTKIQSGCAEFADQNVSASAPVNVLL